jgi:hypothetical protein
MIDKSSGFKVGSAAFWGVLVFAFSIMASPAFAGTDVDDVSKNIIKSAENLPGLLTVLSYLLALLLGVTGVLKLKEHVENPSQAPLRTAIIRFIIGGALLALPMIYEAMLFSINGGATTTFTAGAQSARDMKNLSGQSFSFLQAANINAVLSSIGGSIDELPGIITVGAYLFGLLLGVAGLLKIKDHVENPDRVEMKEGVIRLLTGGALFALPTIYEATFLTINSSGLVGGIQSILGMSGGGSVLGVGIVGGVGTYGSGAGPLGGRLSGLLNGCTSVGGSLGNVICSAFMNASALPVFLTMLGYLIGLGMVVWGIMKIKAHVLNPAQVGLSEGVTRLLAGGMFFALPAIVVVAMATVRNPIILGAAVAPHSGYKETASACTGLDGMLYCAMANTIVPINMALNFFAFCAGVILIMVGISRLIKSAQEGAKGPLGMGTVMTFLAGGALCSYNELMRAATGTFFLIPQTKTNAALKYTKGMDPAEVAHAHTVISAIIKFMIIVGLISFVRGIFIIRESADGNQQASIMAGVTHMVGGALAVNLGPLLNAVQSTLGLTGFGIQFS